MNSEADGTKIAVLVEKVGTMNITLTKLDGKIDTMTDKFATREQVGILEKKVISLENWRIWIAGIATALAVMASFAKDYFFGVHRP